MTFGNSVMLCFNWYRYSRLVSMVLEIKFCQTFYCIIAKRKVYWIFWVLFSIYLDLDKSWNPTLMIIKNDIKRIFKHRVSALFRTINVWWFLCIVGHPVIWCAVRHPVVGTLLLMTWHDVPMMSPMSQCSHPLQCFHSFPFCVSPFNVIFSYTG